MATTRSRGFSLLELLVVVVIIGILASLFTLSIGVTSGDRDLERSADQLQALLELASEDAVLRGQELGLRFYPHAYEFSTLDPEDNGWELVLGDPLLRQRELGEDIELVLTIEGREIDLQQSADDSEQARRADASRKDDDEDRPATDESAYRPQVFVYSSGDISPPFTLEMRRRFGELHLILEVQADGTIERSRENF